MEEPKIIVERWLKEFAFTAARGDIDRHLALVSQHLHVFGLSERGFLEYDDWVKRRRNDLKSRRLLRLRYHHLTIKHFGHNRITFRVQETIKGSSGEHYTLDKLVTLEMEEGKVWRVAEEHIDRVLAGGDLPVIPPLGSEPLSVPGTP